jgi:glycosyltransferase involved in cell wall biosynthesis
MLDRTLENMRRLRIPADVDWELLVVNNNCTDDTDRVIAQHASRLPIRRLYEPRPGKSFAANLAVAEARSDLLIWTDDDVLVDPDWLAEYLAAARDWPDAAYFGGTIEPDFAHPPARWIERNLDLLAGVFAIRRLGDGIRPLGPEEVPYGANMALRRAKIGPTPFNPDLGPRERDETRGEETDLIRRLIARGSQGVWVGPAKVKHHITSRRLTVRYVKEFWIGQGRSEARRTGSSGKYWTGNVPPWVLRNYASSTVTAWCLAPFRTRAWLRAVKTAAFNRGIVREASAARPEPAGLPDSERNGI